MNRKCVLLSLVAMLVLCAVMPRVTVAADPAAAPAVAPSMFDLLVTGPDDKPVAGAAITAYVDGKSNKSATNATGHVLVPMPRKPNSYFRVAVRAPKFVDESVDWQSPKSDPIPPSYTLKMQAGTHISGKIVDDAGQPVSGAHVELNIYTQAPSSHERMSGNASLQSDANGVWSYDGAPADAANVHVGAWDYRYANGDYYSLNEVNPAQAKDGSFTITLTRGVAVEGTVLTPEGTPLAAASVATGTEGNVSNRIPARKTDKDGHFEYFARPGEQVVLTVIVKGYAPELNQFVMGNEKHDVTIQLAKSTPMVGRVVDPEGKPVPGAWIYADTWRGFRTLSARIHADRTGKFTWIDPTDTVMCDIDATGQGFIRTQNVPLTVGDQELVVTVQRSPTVHGTVTDADTNEPIQSFNVIQGISFGSQQPVSWQRQQIQAGKAGKFEFTLQMSYPGYAVRVEADGYTPTESRVFTDSEKQINLDIKMKKGKSIAATVLTADGKPVAGARVWLLIPGQNISLQNGRELYAQNSPTVSTDAEGKCTFPPDSGSFKLVVVHDTGYAEASARDLAKSGEIHLRPWGSVHGKLMIGSKPWASQEISGQIIDAESQRGYDPSVPHVYHQIQATTDAQGSFVIDRIPPGTLLIGRQVKQGSGQMQFWTMGQREQITVEPGKTAEVTIGDTGRPVEGQVTIPPALAARHDWAWGWNTQAQARPVTRSWLGGFLAMAAKKPGENKPDASKPDATTKPARQEITRFYPLEIGPDGKFRIEDVDPGTYTVSLNIMAVSANANGGFDANDSLAMGHAEFTVPEIPGGRSDEALALPAFTMTMVPHVNVGDVAPDFSMKTSDGKDIKLSDYKGKFVLLNFFGNGIGVDTGDIAALKSVNATFSGDERFAMVAVDIYGSPADLAKYAKDNSITWQSAAISGNPSPMETFPIRTLPSVWLIGPDGKLVAKEIHGDGIKAALTTALGPQGL